MEQTAIEFFVEKLNQFNGEDNPWFDIPLSLLEQAKEMEKEQIIKAFNEGTFSLDEKINAEEYYNETYDK